MSDFWQTLVATALMGTERQSPDLSGPTGPLGELLNHLDISDPEAAVLSAGGAVSLYAQAGITATTRIVSKPTPCDLEDLPRCSDLTRQHLQTILGGAYRPALPELLGHLHSAGQRVPEEALPALLREGRQHTHLRSVIRNAIGKRGQWLAQLNPDWAYLSDQFTLVDAEGSLQTDRLQDLWDTGSQATRLALFQELRRLAPDQARQQLAATWKQEKAKDRAALLGCFERRLSLDDEAFLEAALDDRSREVRHRAADLLSHLPDSQLCQRMTERMRFLVSIGVQGQRLVVDISLPENPDPVGQRDGLQGASKGKAEELAGLLTQMIGAVPLAYWQGQAELSGWFTAASESHWQAFVLRGWCLACQRQQNSEWAQGLINYYLEHPQTTNLEDCSALLSLWPASTREKMLVRWLRVRWQGSDRSYGWGRLDAIREANPVPSLEFSEQILVELRPVVLRILATTKRNVFTELRWILEPLAYYLEPDSVERATQFAVQLPEEKLGVSGEESLRDWLDILAFRQRMRQAF